MTAKVELLTPSGGKVILDPTDTAVDRTLTLPAVAGTVFNQGNVVGTVSQSSGVPTGAIIERGSNANGDYVKYADGTMICSLFTTTSNQAINNAYASLFQGTRAWNFPATFSNDLVSCTCGCFKWGTSASWSTIAQLPSSSSVSLRGIDVSSRPTGTQVVISATAIGRWY